MMLQPTTQQLEMSNIISLKVVSEELRASKGGISQKKCSIILELQKDNRNVQQMWIAESTKPSMYTMATSWVQTLLDMATV